MWRRKKWIERMWRRKKWRDKVWIRNRDERKKSIGRERKEIAM